MPDAPPPPPTAVPPPEVAEPTPPRTAGAERDPGGALERCPNCEAVLGGPFCGTCGQERLGEHALTFRAAFRDVFKKFLRVDRAFFKALRLVLFRPGARTADYVAGRRQRHLSPPKLYFLVNFFFFFLVKRYDPITADVAAEFVGPEAWAAAEARSGQSASAFAAAVESGIAGVFATWLFLLVVAMGLVLALLYARRREPFGVHAFFAYDFLSFILIAFTPGTVFAGALGEALVNVALLVLIPVWGALALRRVYGQGWATTLWKTVLLWVGFVLALYLYVEGVIAWVFARM